MLLAIPGRCRLHRVSAAGDVEPRAGECEGAVADPDRDAGVDGRPGNPADIAYALADLADGDVSRRLRVICILLKFRH